MTKRPSRPRDTNQLAKMIVDLATGAASEDKPAPESAAALAGRKGGIRGGKIRAERMTAEQRQEAAKRAVAARWTKSKSEKSD